MLDPVSGILEMPSNGSEILRSRLGLGRTDQLRVTYIPGPGDVAGSFAYWRSRRNDPRVPIAAYSVMFYELVHRLDASAQILAHHPIDAALCQANDQFRFEHVGQRSASGRWSYLFSQWIYARDLVAAARSFDPHIVVTSTHAPATAWKALARGRKLVLSAHNTFWPMGHPPRSLKARLRRAILERHAMHLDAAACTSHECARQIGQITNGRIQGEVQCPQIVTQYPVASRDRVRRLLFLGRVEPSKGIFLMLDVFERLAHQHLDLTLVLAGAGSADAALSERISASRFADRMKFLGRLPSDAVHAEIAASDLLVCPTMTSFNEGLATVGFEAAAHGIPSLISSVVPAADLLGDSCTIFEADNATAFESALSRLIENDAEYRARCSATANVREKIYNPELSWASGLFRAMMSA